MLIYTHAALYKTVAICQNHVIHLFNYERDIPTVILKRYVVLPINIIVKVNTDIFQNVLLYAS